MKHYVLITLLICFLFVGCNIPIFSYPRFWDYTKAKPKDADLVGSYRVLKVRLSGELARMVTEKKSQITLNADHTAILTDVPEFDEFGEKLECRLSGSAKWKLDDGINSGSGWSVAFQDYHPSFKMTIPGCGFEDTTWGISILSRHAPYRLYESVGDPDSDTGIEYEMAR